MSITAKGFVPREVEDFVGDLATVDVFVNDNASVPARVRLRAEEFDYANEDGRVTLVFDAPEARTLAAHLIQAAEAVEAAQ